MAFRSQVGLLLALGVTRKSLDSLKTKFRFRIFNVLCFSYLVSQLEDGERNIPPKTASCSE